MCLFELESKAAALDAKLKTMYPGRAGITVYPGDCNMSISRALADLVSIRWAPTFAFVDQFDSEIRWQTLEQIARFRRGKTKAEMWILLGTSFYQRGLNVRKESMDARYGETMTDMFGSEEWVPIIQARRAECLEPAEVRAESFCRTCVRLDSARSVTLRNQPTRARPRYEPAVGTSPTVGPAAGATLCGMETTQHSAGRAPYRARPGRGVIVANALADLRGPTHGLAELPLWLFWNPDRTFDLDQPGMLRWMYENVLREATRAEDLTTYLNGEILVAVWSDLFLPKGVRQAWQERHPQLRATASAA
ncbi:MAG: three-Cys-motif partner protein TcmP [Mycobacterium sp.]|nr:three-Cys-motif partner protein TcmP [Mycobacterium sp.]